MRLEKLFILIFLAHNLFSQDSELIIINDNHIPNAGFESYYECPGVKDGISLAIGWRSPTGGTPDYINKCGLGQRNTPKYYGIEPLFQDAYAGIITWKETKKKDLGNPFGWREYIFTVLKKPLIKGQKYKATLWYALSKRSKYFCPDIGMLFCKTPFINYKHVSIIREIKIDARTKEDIDLSHIKPNISNENMDTQNLYEWKEMSATFTAEGGERFLYIGNFKANNESHYGIANNLTDDNKDGLSAYYLIDNVSTKPYIDKRIKEKKIPDEGLSFRLNNLYFELDSYELLESARKTLDRMIRVFLDYKGLKVEVQGHTDDIADEAYNIRLSTNRAKAIYNYLIKIGCPKDALSFKGYGESKPIAPNTNDKNRELNRRVEFKVLAR